MNVSIIIPIYNPDRKILKEIDRSLKNQKFSGKVEIIKVDKGLGLADSFNYGIKKAKYPIIVTLHQDCIPTSNDWLKKLVEPLKKKEMICSISQVELPYKLWNKFDIIAKILSVKEQKVLVSFEKASAYKKSALLKIGLFDGKKFRTAGEDCDLHIKLEEIKNFTEAFPQTKVLHYHPHKGYTRFKKEYQLSNGFGALVRIYGSKNPGWYIGLIKSIPIIGWPVFLTSINIKKLGIRASLLAIPLYLLVNFIYSYGFWKGFIAKKQQV